MNPRPRKYGKRKDRVSYIRNSIVCEKSLDDIARDLLLKQFTIIRYAREAHIKIPGCIYYSRRRPEIDALVEQGLSLNQIGAAGGYTRERARQYIHATNQYKCWKEKRRNLKEMKKTDEQRKKLLRQLVSLLELRILELSEQRSWADKKAVEYKRLKPRTPCSLDYLTTLFKTYEEAETKGIKLSLHRLGVIIGIRSTLVGRILESVHVKPMYRKISRTITPKEKREMIERGFHIPLTNVDIGYFIGVPRYIVSHVFTKMGHRCNIHGEQVSCRVASQIYECLDLGFTTQETCELLDTREKIVDYVKEVRNILGGRIITALQVLLNNKNINTPYLP